MERAYQLADCAAFESVEEICQRLLAEGYDNVFLSFEGRTATRADLLRKCRRARSKVALTSARKPSAQSRSRRFRARAAETRRLAERAKSERVRSMYRDIAAVYDRLAMSAAAQERPDNEMD